MSRILFFIREALRALGRSAAPSLAAIVTIALTVLLLGVLIPVLSATGSTTEEVRKQIGLEVFLFPEVSNKEAKRLQPRIERISHVRSVEFVSKKEGLHFLRRELEAEGDEELVEQFPRNRNPLPAAFRVRLDDPDNLEAVRSDLSPPNERGKPEPISPLIEEVEDAREEAEPIREVTGAIKIVLGAIAALLLGASLLLVANTIRLSIYARRREVEVMRLVGATNWFIRWPFVIEGLVVGFIGALGAVAILWIGKVTIVDPLSDSLALVEAQKGNIDFALLVGILIACAMAVSALGSGFTLRRFLRV
jgi:cell division transport system permease protein